MIGAIIQARMGSSRLPGKVLADIEGKTMLERVIDRVRLSKRVDTVVLATTLDPGDDPIVDLANSLNVPVFRGMTDDVLDRYYRAANFYELDVIVRVTADCPLIDPAIIDQAVEAYVTGDYDHVSTAYPKATFPDGLDVWVFSAEALKRAWEEATLTSEREHVTPYMWNNPDLFKLFNVECSRDLSHLRWTVDEERDLEFVRHVYRHFGVHTGDHTGMDDVLNLLDQVPDLLDKNRSIGRDEGYLKSLDNDTVLRKTGSVPPGECLNPEHHRSTGRKN